MLQKSYLGYSPLGFHNVAYTQWGQENPARPPVICVHGLTRNGRDFDRLAEKLENETRVFCPDVVGRGKSDWFSDPALYTYPQYLNDMAGMIACTGAGQVDWVGTSMGGILGMLLAAMPKNPIRRLVINDVGPFISLEALRRIADYVGVVPEFADLEQAERYLRQIYAPFGITEDEDWRTLTRNSIRNLLNGKLTLSHDPAIVSVFKTLDKDADFWDVYDRIKCPVLVLHGRQSDILSADTARQMTERGPKAQLVDFPSVGHAPALVDITQTGLIAQFLRT